MGPAIREEKAISFEAEWRKPYQRRHRTKSRYSGLIRTGTRRQTMSWLTSSRGCLMPAWSSSMTTDIGEGPGRLAMNILARTGYHSSKPNRLHGPDCLEALNFEVPSNDKCGY